MIDCQSGLSVSQREGAVALAARLELHTAAGSRGVIKNELYELYPHYPRSNNHCGTTHEHIGLKH